MDAEGLAKIRALSKRRNEAEEEDEEEETTRDRVRAQPGHGEHFLFASEFSNGPIKKKKKKIGTGEKSSVIRRSHSNRGLDLIEIFLHEHCHSRTFRAYRRVEAQYLECRA